MKHLINRILPFLFLAILTPVLASCGDDEENTPDSPQIQKENYFKGTTTTFPVDNPSSVYTSDKSTYLVTLDPESNKASISIENADFLQGMPQLGVMTFNSLTYSVDNEATDENGTAVVKLKCEALDPEIANRPFPAFPITDLSATMLTDKSLSLTFICTYRGTPFTVKFKGSPAK